jgi:uncharacterized protein YvpB
MPLVLQAHSATSLKRQPIPSTQLPIDQKRPLSAGAQMEIIDFGPEQDHVRLRLPNDSADWYASIFHIYVKDGAQQLFPKILPKQVRLDVPYRSQMNNAFNPTGACNVTSIAMGLLYFGIGPRQPDQFPQFEDELYDYTDRMGLNRHQAPDLVKLFEAYGGRDDFSSTANLHDVKQWLSQQKPVIIQGYLTSFGHILVAVGYDEKGLIVHDPYGEWHSWGYDRNDAQVVTTATGTKGRDNKGKYQNYSYALIESTCMPDGNLWAHFISKP